jgi:hypothetical protein
MMGMKAIPMILVMIPQEEQTSQNLLQRGNKLPVR